jgi:hypothetical protein
MPDTCHAANGFFGECTLSCAHTSLQAQTESDDVEIKSMHRLARCPNTSRASDTLLLLGNRSGAQGTGGGDNGTSSLTDHVFGHLFAGESESFTEDAWTSEPSAELMHAMLYEDQLYLAIQEGMTDQVSNDPDPPFLERLRANEDGVFKVGDTYCEDTDPVATWQVQGSHIQPGTSAWLDTGVDDDGVPEDYLIWGGSMGAGGCVGTDCDASCVHLGSGSRECLPDEWTESAEDRAALLLGFAADTPEPIVHTFLGCYGAANAEPSEVEIEDIVYLADRDLTGACCSEACGGTDVCEASPYHECVSSAGGDVRTCGLEPMPFLVVGEFSKYLPRTDEANLTACQDDNAKFIEASGTGGFLVRYEPSENDVGASTFVAKKQQYFVSDREDGIKIRDVVADVKNEKVFVLLRCAGECTVYTTPEELGNEDEVVARINFNEHHGAGLLLLRYGFGTDDANVEVREYLEPEGYLAIWKPDGAAVQTDALIDSGFISLSAGEDGAAGAVLAGGCFRSGLRLAAGFFTEDTVDVNLASLIDDQTTSLSAHGGSQDFFIARLRSNMTIASEYTAAYGAKKYHECIQAIQPIDGPGYRAAIVAGTYTNGNATGSLDVHDDPFSARFLELASPEDNAANIFMGRIHADAPMQ